MGKQWEIPKVGKRHRVLQEGSTPAQKSPPVESWRGLVHILMGRRLDKMDFCFPLGREFEEPKQNKRGLETAAWVCFLLLFEIKCY